MIFSVFKDCFHPYCFLVWHCSVFIHYILMQQYCMFQNLFCVPVMNLVLNSLSATYTECLACKYPCTASLTPALDIRCAFGSCSFRDMGVFTKTIGLYRPTAFCFTVIQMDFVHHRLLRHQILHPSWPSWLLWCV